MRPDLHGSAIRAVARAIARHATLTPAGGVDPHITLPTSAELGDQLGYTRRWIDVQVQELIAAGAILDYPALPPARPRPGEPKQRTILIDPIHTAWDGLLPGDYVDPADQGPDLPAREEVVL